MIAAVANTHAALWLLFGDARLSALAKDLIDKAADARRKVVLTPISLAEVVYLIEKDRLPASAFADLRTALNNPNHVLAEAPFTADVVQVMRQIPRSDVPDMPDRIIAATAVSSGCLSSAGTAAFARPPSRRCGDEPTFNSCTSRRSRGWSGR